MARTALTGSRIRARRLDLNLRQSDLAKACGISASYLNLIEHNRRRIGGKLLVDIARTLDLEVSALSQGADAALLADLRAAALAGGEPEAAERAEEFAGRFPDWARVLAWQGQRIAELEHAVETLSDRLAHDPFLSSSLHDVLSAAAAIHATSAILAEEADVDPAWQARFHRNLHEDSGRLAEASRTLASYLDAGSDGARAVLSPQEEFQAWLEAQGFRLDWVEAGAAPDADAARLAAASLARGPAEPLARAHLAEYRDDARKIPEPLMLAALAEDGPDPARLARRFGGDYPAVFRRMAALAGRAGLAAVGLVVVDAAGALVLRKPVEGFPLPLHGAACPLWPLYEALARPGAPLRRRIELAGRVPRRFDAYAAAETRIPQGFDGPLLPRATMLLLPVPGEEETEPALRVGTACRICARRRCPARREPSVLPDTTDVQRF